MAARMLRQFTARPDPCPESPDFPATPPDSSLVPHDQKSYRFLDSAPQAVLSSSELLFFWITQGAGNDNLDACH
jgi:hypothetical protein